MSEQYHFVCLARASFEACLVGLLSLVLLLIQCPKAMQNVKRLASLVLRVESLESRRTAHYCRIGRAKVLNEKGRAMFVRKLVSFGAHFRRFQLSTRLSTWLNPTRGKDRQSLPRLYPANIRAVKRSILVASIWFEAIQLSWSQPFLGNR